MLLLWKFLVIQDPSLCLEFDIPIFFHHPFFASGSYQRRHSDDVWARDEGQTTASEDCREGISCFSIEEPNLRPSWILIGHAERLMLVAPWGFGAQLVFRGSALCTLRVQKSPCGDLLSLLLWTLWEIWFARQNKWVHELNSCDELHLLQLQKIWTSENCSHSLPLDAKFFEISDFFMCKPRKTHPTTK